MEQLQSLIGLFAGHPLLLVFLVSAAGNSVPYMTTPYLLFIAGYSAMVESPLERVGIIIAGGAGAAVGKLVVYFIGRGARLLLSSKTRRGMERAMKVFSKSVFLAVFLFAALPLPDDVLYMPLGIMGYNVLRYFIAVLSGKIIITSLAVALGSSISLLLGEAGPLWAGIAAAVIGVAASILIARMDWDRVLEAYEEKGALAAARAVVEEALRALGAPTGRS
ncbi:MAG: VTT domain-containing protein [Pyrodictiaceae archaeon]